MRFFVFLAEERGRVGGLPEERRGTVEVLAHVTSGAVSRPGKDDPPVEWPLPA